MHVDRIGWLTFWFLAVLGFVFGVVGIAHGNTPTLTERLASKTDPPVDAAELANAITSVPRVTREWAALLLTIAHHESALSARIAAGDCRPHECDRGKAFGLYQQHKNTFNASVWGSTDIRVQTLEAARALRSAFYSCGVTPAKLPRADWASRTLNCYAGRSPDAVWPGLDARLVTFKQVSSRL